MDAMKQRNRPRLQTVAIRFQKNYMPPNDGNSKVGDCWLYVNQYASKSIQIGVCAGTGQVQIVFDYPIDQNPVRFNVCSTVSIPSAFQRVILVCLRQWLFVDKQKEQGTQLIHLFAAFFTSRLN